MTDLRGQDRPWSLPRRERPARVGDRADRVGSIAVAVNPVPAHLRRAGVPGWIGVGAVGPGDVVIIPPNTPHWFSEISSDQIVYLVVRVDPHKILPAGFKPK
jgi:hypothetical protein